MRAQIRHNGKEIAADTLEYAGRLNVWKGRFQLGRVEKNYEVLEIAVVAIQENTANYGSFQRTYKLIP